ncbi:hypothetical protein F506_19855 [Herbaspirillum hiltneri N3]|uniref:Integrase catalytic domain-containing protein n=2 Tax=Herbaspirillum TaxID=963 RepID=A0ABM5V4Q1_9BURK|nr:hypothetical protein F506_19855 [Herbaspirillum hiltneri N3]
MGQVIQAESRSLELTAVTLWEHDDDVYEYYDQPPQLRLNTKTTLGQVTGYGYTPDFFVLAKDFIGWVECKKTEFLEGEVANGKTTFIFEKNQWLHVPGSQYAKSLGLQFEVFTECSFSSAQLNNTVFLEDYWRVGCAAIGLVEQKEIRKLFEGAPFLTLGNLIGRGGDGTADIIYKMLADEQLHFLAEEEHLSEHSSTKIFLEIAEAKAYSFRKKIALTQDAEIYQSPVITLAVGSRLKWKNKIYEIVEAGDDNRCLKGPDDRAIFLPIDDLERLIAIGDIKSGEPEETARAEAATICNGAHPKEIEDALERLQCLKEPERIFSVTGKKPCPRIRRTWEARARKSKELYGCEYILLIDRAKSRGNRTRRLVPAVLDEIGKMAEVWKTEDISVNAIHAMLAAVCTEKGLLIPSVKALRRELKNRVKAYDQTLGSQGEKAAYIQKEFVWFLDRTSPPHGERFLEVAHIDHTKMDVHLIDSLHGGNLGRPWLSLLIDAYTRVILAFVLTYDAPSYRTLMLLMRECVRRHHRVPRTIVSDAGSEFLSAYWEQLLARLEITKRERPAGQSRNGSVIEAAFGVVDKDFTHQLTGTSKRLKKPRGVSRSHDPRKHAIWNLPVLTEELDKYIYEVYPTLNHSALGTTPQQAMEHSKKMGGSRAWKYVSYEESRVLFLPSYGNSQITLIPGRGLKVGPFHYFSNELQAPELEGKRFLVRYDPFDLSYVYAYVNRRWRRCETPMAGHLKGRTEKEIALITDEYNAKYRQKGKKLKETLPDYGRYLQQTFEKENILKQQKRDAELNKSIDLEEHNDTEPVAGEPENQIPSQQVQIIPALLGGTTVSPKKLSKFQFREYK